MSNNPTNQNEPTRPSQAVASFIAEAKSPTKLPGKPIESRIIFGLDATASREPTWDQASQIQHEMFAAVQSDQRLAVQLCFYRGFRELKASRFCHSATELQGLMGQVRCRGGHTQINRLLKHALKISRVDTLKAVLFVGDAIEESVDDLCDQAGLLGLKKIPLFIFHEGHDVGVERTFRAMTKLSGGAYAPFDLASPDQLKRLLAGAAAYATGGHAALGSLAYQQPGLKQLTSQLPKT
jgi:hypothetical protein